MEKNFRNSPTSSPGKNSVGIMSFARAVSFKEEDNEYIEEVSMLPEELDSDEEEEVKNQGMINDEDSFKLKTAFVRRRHVYLEEMNGTISVLQTDDCKLNNPLRRA